MHIQYIKISSKGKRGNKYNLSLQGTGMRWLTGTTNQEVVLHIPGFSDQLSIGAPPTNFQNSASLDCAQAKSAITHQIKTQIFRQD